MDSGRPDQATERTDFTSGAGIASVSPSFGVAHRRFGAAAVVEDEPGCASLSMQGQPALGVPSPNGGSGLSRDSNDITARHPAGHGGDDPTTAELSTLVYQQLRQMARRRLADERPGHTLQPTALVHEVYLRMAEQGADQRGRVRFFAMAALHMRSILVDHARARLSEKRGGGALRITLQEGVSSHDGDREADFLALDQALHSLQEEDERTARVIELHYFSGLKREEIAQVMAVSIPTVDRDLRFGKAWLRHVLAVEDDR